jgi:DNA repair protein RadD
MPLRDYQENALAEISREWRQGARAVLLVLPTGGGKTAIGSEAIRRAVARGKSALFLAHRRELISQASKRLTAEGIHHGIVMAGVPTTAAPVQIASIDTLKARDTRPPANFVIWDESHHVSSDGWSALQAEYPNAHHLGLTATPCRADGKGLGDIFGAMVVGATVAQLTEGGYLVPCDIEAPAQKLSKKIAQDPVEAYLARCAGEKALVYAGSVKEAHSLAERFLRAGVSAAAIDGTTKAELRDEVLRRFASGEIRVLCNMAVLCEGFDCPDASVCIVARPVGHVGLWLQIVGRVLRPAPGKSRALVLDLAGSVHQHGLPEEPREYSLGGEGIVAQKTTSIVVCQLCGFARRGYPCARCGYMPAEVKLTVTGEPLVLVAGKFKPNDEKTAVSELARLAAERGHAPGWITHAFRERYGYEIGKQRYSAAKDYYESIREDLRKRRTEILEKERADDQRGERHEPNLQWCRVCSHHPQNKWKATDRKIECVFKDPSKCPKCQQLRTSYGAWMYCADHREADPGRDPGGAR